MKLNLGSGGRNIDGYVSVDLAKADVIHDLSEPLPFENESADEIVAFHVIEHFWRWEVERVLADWVRVLKPGGLLVLECPCLDKILGIFQQCVDQRKPVPSWLMWGLYGDPGHKNPAMCHRWAYGQGELSRLMKEAGLDVTMCEPKTHVKVRDMRLEGVKRGN